MPQDPRSSGPGPGPDAEFQRWTAELRRWAAEEDTTSWGVGQGGPFKRVDKFAKSNVDTNK